MSRAKTIVTHFRLFQLCNRLGRSPNCYAALMLQMQHFATFVNTPLRRRKQEQIELNNAPARFQEGKNSKHSMITLMRGMQHTEHTTVSPSPRKQSKRLR